MLRLPFQTGEELENLLIRVFLKAADSSPVQQRLALTFAIHGPSAWLRVDGRGGQTATLSRGEIASREDSDLNAVAAMTAGKLQITGPLLRALALAPGLKKVQAAYREETGGLAAGETEIG